MTDRDLTQNQRVRVRRMIAATNLSEGEARFVVALEDGEVRGDLVREDVQGHEIANEQRGEDARASNITLPGDRGIQ